MTRAGQETKRMPQCGESSSALLAAALLPSLRNSTEQDLLRWASASLGWNGSKITQFWSVEGRDIG